MILKASKEVLEAWVYKSITFVSRCNITTLKYLYKHIRPILNYYLCYSLVIYKYNT